MVVTLVGLASTAPPAFAQAELEAEAGFGGAHEFGADLLIRVRVATDRLIEGELQARPTAAFGSFPLVQVPIQAAGGTTKEFLLVFPSFNEWAGDMQVSLIEGDVVSATTVARVAGLNQGELVGVLPSLSDDWAGVTSLSVPLGDARAFAIDQRWLDAGVGAIDALSSIVASGDDLQALSPAGADVIEQWVFQGGTLVLDEPPGVVPALGLTSEPGPVSHGHGQIVTTEWARSQGRADSLLAPAERRMSMNSPFPEMTGDMPWFGGQLSNELASDAGFGLPPLPWVLALLGIYIVLVGPLAWFVLRRMGKSRLLWSVLPLLAVVFTAGVWLAGSTIRSNTTSAHGTIVEVSDGRAQTTSTVLALSRNGGRVGVSLPEGWRVAPSQSENFGPGGIEGPTTLLRTGTADNRIDVDLAAGQFATMTGRGPAPEYIEAVTAVAAAPTNGGVNGSVTNNLDVELHEVVVFAGGNGINIGSIGPNVTVPFTMRAAPRNIFGEPIEMALWRTAMEPGMGQFGEPRPTEAENTVNLSLWANYISENLGRSRPPGELTVAGWTNELPSTLDDSIDSGRTLIVASAPIRIANGVLTDFASKRVVLRSPSQLDGGQPNFGAGFILGTAWRFDIPSDVDSTTVGLHIPDQIDKVELWNGQEWTATEDLTSGLYALPPDVVRSGSVTAKIFIDFDRGPRGLGVDLSLQTITSEDTPRGDLLGVVDA